MAGSDLRYAKGSVHGDVLVITILLEAVDDHESAHALQREIFVLVARFEPSHVVIDLQHVLSMGSAGFLVFLALRRRLEPKQVVICNITRRVYELFEVCRLLSTGAPTTGPLEAEETLEEALARFSR